VGLFNFFGYRKWYRNSAIDELTEPASMSHSDILVFMNLVVGFV
jgi:hypothetical protein